MEFLKNSITYKIIMGFINLLENIIKNSFIYNLLTKDVNKEEKINNSIIVKVFYKIIDIFRRLFKILRLDKLFKESIFTKTYIYTVITIALAPIVPTTILMCLIAISIISLLLNILIEDDFKFKYAPTNLTVLLFLFVYIFCAFTSLSPIDSLKTALVVSLGIMFHFVILNSIKTNKQANLAIIIFCLVGLLVSIYGIYQYVTIGFFGSTTVDKELFEDIKTRVTSTFDNPNVLGEYLILVIPLTVSLFFANKDIFKKIVIFFSGCAMLVCLALTYSRGCYLGLILSAAVFIILLNFKFIILFILGLISLPFVLPKSIINRFTSIGNMEDTSTTYRISIWKGSIEVIKDYWYRPIGQGAVAFNKVYPLYAYNQTGAQHSHCLYLQLILETGLIGFIIFISFLYRLYQLLFNGLKKLKNNVERVYLIGFVSGLSGFLVQSIFDNTWHNLRVAVIFWIFASLAASKKIVTTKEATNED